MPHLRVAPILFIAFALFAGCANDPLSSSNGSNALMKVTSTLPWFGYGGMEVEINGANFGTDPGAITVLAGTEPATVKRVTDERITVVLPPNASGTHLIVQRQTSSSFASIPIDFPILQSPYSYTACSIESEGLLGIVERDLVVVDGLRQHWVDTSMVQLTNNYMTAFHERQFKSDTLTSGDTVRVASFERLTHVEVATQAYGVSYHYRRVTAIVDSVARRLKRFEVLVEESSQEQSTDSTSTSSTGHTILVLADVPYQTRNDSTLVATITGEAIRSHLLRYDNYYSNAIEPIGTGSIDSRHTRALIIPPTARITITLHRAR